MSNEMEIIKQIEKQLGIQLKPLPLKKIMVWQENGYALDLRGNQITELAPLRELKHLQRLNVCNNTIQRLPPGIISWWPGMEMQWKDKYRIGLNLYGNPLTDPQSRSLNRGKPLSRTISPK